MTFKGFFWGGVATWPMLAMNLTQMLTMVIYPVSKPAFYRINMWWACVVWRWWGWIIERMHGTRLVFEGDELPEGESAIVIANHQAMADVVLVLSLARRKGRLADCRWIVKDDMKYLPFLGWGMLFLDYLFVKRDWNKDRDTALAAFARYRERLAPLWLVLFPEGTRQTPAKLQESQRYAAKTGQEPPRHVMLPRSKGFVASLHGLRGKIDAVYSICIRYPGKPPGVADFFGGACPEISFRVRRFVLADLPTEDQAVADWLTAEFRRMDAYLSQ